MKKKITEKDFHALYYNAGQPGAFSGVESFMRLIRNTYGLQRISKKLSIDIKKWLSEQETYTLHKPLRKKFTRNQIITMGIDDTWQADLVDVSNISNENDNYKFLLTCIDVFSKYAWIIPLKNKTAPSIIEAFRSIFKERTPRKLQTDKGSEFLNRACQKLLKEHNVQFYTLNSELKASVVERFNRTIREKMWRYFTYTNKKRYIEILDDLVSSYNNSFHRSIKYKPIEVNEKNRDKVWLNLYGFRRSTHNANDLNSYRLKFQVNDKVRISKNKKTFEKGYTPNWTQEIFIVDKIKLRRDRPVYVLRDFNNETIEGVFYEEELQKITNETNIFKIDKILRKKKEKGKIKYFVSWLGYPKQFNSWINSEDLQ